MTLVERLTAQLEPHRSISFQARADAVEVDAAEGGFRVSLQLTPSGATVHFDGWHEEFDDIDEAIQCFMFGLSEKCRLQITYRGKTPTKWVLESKNGDRWIPTSEVGILIAPFWREKRLEYRQNRHVPAA